MKSVAIKKYILLSISIVFALLVLVNINKETIREKSEKVFLSQSTDEKISYIVYDNKDKENSKILLSIQTDNAIEYVIMPNRQ